MNNTVNPKRHPEEEKNQYRHTVGPRKRLPERRHRDERQSPRLEP